jgi:hypothetical protein
MLFDILSPRRFPHRDRQPTGDASGESQIGPGRDTNGVSVPVPPL